MTTRRDHFLRHHASQRGTVTYRDSAGQERTGTLVYWPAPPSRRTRRTGSGSPGKAKVLTPGGHHLSIDPATVEAVIDPAG